ncbi:glutathione-independent formaldehyde dehydrogenase [Comamonas endophytica]|uniref:Glutathione-independent formaldehyde dehydrogenase n=1 Tax=Comamonas endophytica TaxID=2949090 RepID=A0ABY6GAR6_9BURK|nr:MULTISPECIES: glutathione-independent formaldehyde dehydrogenase [unclassified Acidovorax]MCD2513845.1 glutathione-independent formaldehyde dehydrogenase [Acidovorax sp. D4N7]UYG52154.1 glutathione-independent formaldehyde dehydrogenase [Acidovorax sp. 5MLIR]
MKALVYNGPCDVRVQNMPDARIERHTDALVRITRTNICGSDLHMYEGRTDMKPGRILGHENVGEVIEVGRAVDGVKVGDMVSVPFNIGCGFCENCERGLCNYCLTTNPGLAGAAYGFADMGPYHGGQAELLRVPYADYNCLILPRDASEKQNDYVMLSDIFPTGFHATEMAQLCAGESVVIYGAGPVGLMAALSATVKGASLVMVVDTHKDRLALAEQIGAVAIDDSEGGGIERVMELTGGRGADCGCECVGYQCCNMRHEEVPNLTMNNLVHAVKFTGRIGCVGVFVPQDPNAKEKLQRRGQMAFDFGMFWFKGQKLGTGQCPVKAYNRYLSRLIEQEKVKPSWIVSHELPLEQAPEAYRNFDERKEGWTKITLKPNG